jgi:carboxymethylenebutenolidase
MGQPLSLVAADGFKLGAYRADPPGKPKGGVVVIQEIFGVNHHIRSVVGRVAAEGYAAVAPALFDRTQPGASSPATRRTRSLTHGNSWRIRIGTRCCATPKRP